MVTLAAGLRSGRVAAPSWRAAPRLLEAGDHGWSLGWPDAGLAVAVAMHPQGFLSLLASWPPSSRLIFCMCAFVRCGLCIGGNAPWKMVSNRHSSAGRARPISDGAIRYVAPTIGSSLLFLE